MREITYEDLFDYLDNIGKKVRFIGNYMSANGVQDFHQLKQINENYPDTWISSAFVWGDTPQGNEYWDEVDDGWMVWIENIRNETIKLTMELTIGEAELLMNLTDSSAEAQALLPKIEMEDGYKYGYDLWEKTGREIRDILKERKHCK